MNICREQRGLWRGAKRGGITLVLFAAAATAAWGQSAATSAFSGERAARVEATVEQFRKETNAPGIAVAIVENGQYLWSKGFGSADVKRHTPVTPQTLFRLASVSKPITAAGAMQLWER